MGWNLESDDAKIGIVLTETLLEIETYTKSKRLYDPFLFVNDAYLSQNPLRSYGAQNFRKLQQVGNAYDPHKMFQQQMPGGFKLV